MKKIALFLLLGLATVHLSPDLGAEEVKSWADKTGSAWLSSFNGQTLASIGKITDIKIKSSSGRKVKRTEVMEIIEKSKIQDYSSVSAAIGLSPYFSIEYADGMRVTADRMTGTIQMPDGRKGRVVLMRQN